MYERELEVAVNAAKQAGEVVRGYFKDEYTVKDKGEDNPLTDADLGSNDVLERHLRGSFPDYGWLSEETVDSPERLQKRMAWIIDPLDGTKEFTLGIPEFVVSIGLVVEGRAVLGVLYNPIKEELFSGVVGQGATLNGDPIRVSAHTDLMGARIVCSRTEMKKGMFEKFLDRVVPVPVGSVAYKFGMVAAGRAEATFTPQPRNEWDICGGCAIVEAAGGRTSNRHGETYMFNRKDPLHDGVAATNGSVHQAILGLMET